MITQFGVSQDPNDNPFGSDAVYSTEVKILWNYKTETVVDGGDVRCSLFDTLHVYMYMAGDSLPWRLSRFPGEHVYVAERAVPELVQLAAMVSS